MVETSNYKTAIVNGDGSSNNNNNNNNNSAVQKLARRKSKSLSFYVESQKIDAATLHMLQQYDVNGDGVFSKDEVSRIVIDLQHTLQHNERLDQNTMLLKRLMVGMALFLIVLLAGVFALSYAANSLAQQVSVGSNGIMYLSGGDDSIVVATDSASTMFVLDTPLTSHLDDTDVGSAYCMEQEQYDDILQHVLNGNSVLLKFDGNNDIVDTNNNTESSSSLSHVAIQQLQASGMTMDSDTNGDTKTCFVVNDGADGGGATHRYLCAVPSDECATTSTGRRLKGSAARGILIDYE